MRLIPVLVVIVAATVVLAGLAYPDTQEVFRTLKVGFVGVAVACAVALARKHAER